MTHLWEIDHPYYCHEENYFKNGQRHTYTCWAEFNSFFAGVDADQDLIFRWDWDLETGQLALFVMQQRRGLYCAHIVTVVPEDEPVIREFLMAGWRLMTQLWAPISAPEGDGAA